MNKKEEILIRKQMSESDKGVLKSFGVAKADISSEEEHVIRVKFASFGNIDSDGDLLVKGCFAKSIAERGPGSTTNRKIAFLWQHDRTDPIGRILSIEEKDDGAYATIKMSNFDAVPNARRAWQQLLDGDINQFSFGAFYVWEKCEYDEELDAFVVKEMDLRELSVVTLGANEQTQFEGIVTTIKQLDKYMDACKQIAPKKREEMIASIRNLVHKEEQPHKSLFAKIGQTI